MFFVDMYIYISLDSWRYRYNYKFHKFSLDFFFELKDTVVSTFFIHGSTRSPGELLERRNPCVSHERTMDDYGICISGWWFGTFFIFPYIGNNHPK